MKSLKIAMIGQKRCPSREGGVEVVVEELATRLVKMGNQVTCFNRSGHHVSGKEYDVEYLKEYQGIKLKKVFTIDKKGLAALSSSFFASIQAALGNFDVVHFHCEGPGFMCFIPKLFGKRIIVTIHGLDWKRSKWGTFASWSLKQGEKMIVRYADEIIVLSKNVQNYFKETYHRETHYIPNGVNKPEKVKANLITEKFGLTGEDYILYLGRLVPEKGVKLLIETFKTIRTDKKLVIAGGHSNTISFESELKKIAQDDDRIIFTGFVQGELLEELYSNAYFYTLPSELEGMPISLLEALSYENCCLTSDIPECTEVLMDNGVTFEKNNSEDLANKIIYLCENSEIVSVLKKNVSDAFFTKHSWDQVALETLKIYEQ